MATSSVTQGPTQLPLDKVKKKPDIDSTALHQVVQKAMEAAAQRSNQPISPRSPNKEELRFRLKQLASKGQTTPPAAKMSEEKPTPRTEAANAIRDRLSLGNRPASRQLNLDGVLTVTPAVIQEKKTAQKSLEALLDGYQVKFGQFIKDNTKEPQVKKGELPRMVRIEPLIALRSVFLAVKDRDFLDRYIIRHSLPEEEQKEFTSFHNKLAALKQELEKAGVCGPQAGESINFWSGKEGQARAAEDEESLSDSDVPLFKFLFDCWGYIRQQDALKPGGAAAHLVPLLPILFSAVFADFASGDVNVYMSSKNDGKQSVINVDSAFWSAELYALTQNPQVSKVDLYLHKGKDPLTNQDIWEQPIDLKSQDPDVVKLKDEVVSLSRRGDQTLQIPMGNMREMLKSWQSKAKELHLLPDVKELEEESNC